MSFLQYSNEKSIFQNRHRIHDNNLHTYTYCFSTWEICTCCNSLIENPHPPNSFVSACKEKGVVVLIRLMLEKHWIYEFNVHDFQILGRGVIISLNTYYNYIFRRLITFWVIYPPLLDCEVNRIRLLFS